MFTGTVVCTAVLIVSQAATAGAAVHQGGLHFGALLFDGPGADLPRTNSKLNAEYVDLHNNTGQALHLRGYTVKTAAGALYTFPAFTLAAWKTVRLKSGQGSSTAATVFRQKDTFWFNNSSGALTLTAPGRAKKDTCAWKANGRGYTTCH
ncbi:hypothetical protein ADK55_03295 [Streptomyces sp. WM4235]|uniref:lamin tail domain-containing protein n=1 Tax=Streptomyces sp. WM4235 TaxID=1415551 RepID=UPI0006C5D0E4|nr:lamin tail domain-containing protein [Streptomyces sp. WM4235]KOU67462.1 hypothetical protein ADK55_03295 [Streptomyces sp. WM4235]